MSAGEIQSTPGLTQTVAKHYNELQESGLAERTKSRIFYLRNFNNWIKSMVISEFLNKLRTEHGPNSKLTVLDLCSGKGGDLLKWKKGGIHELVCADIAEQSVIQCTIRYKEMVDRNRAERRPSQMFTSQFIPADCTKKRLRNIYRDPEMKFDLTSCQFSFHYSFESYHQADMMLRNACECLKLGGYFIGTTPNSYELIKRLRTSEDMSFGNDVYKIKFNIPDKENIPLFHAQYDFNLEGVVDCPEFVVHFPTLEVMAEKYGMKLVKKSSFHKYFKEHISVNENRSLINRMQGLEPYPADEDIELMGTPDVDYVHSNAKVEELEAERQNAEERQRKPIKVGTLSQAEWDAATIYLMFAFQKVRDVVPPYDESVHATPKTTSNPETESQSSKS